MLIRQKILSGKQQCKEQTLFCFRNCLKQGIFVSNKIQNFSNGHALLKNTGSRKNG